MHLHFRRPDAAAVKVEPGTRRRVGVQLPGHPVILPGVSLHKQSGMALPLPFFRIPLQNRRRGLSSGSSGVINSPANDTLNGSLYGVVYGVVNDTVTACFADLPQKILDDSRQRALGFDAISVACRHLDDEQVARRARRPLMWGEVYLTLMVALDRVVQEVAGDR
jgi:hypothetical protein